MAKYYFDVNAEPGTMGVSLPDEEHARAYALLLLGDLIKEAVLDRRGRLYWRMDVRRGHQPSSFSILVELNPAMQLNVEAIGSCDVECSEKSRAAN